MVGNKPCIKVGSGTGGIHQDHDVEESMMQEGLGGKVEITVELK